VSRTIALVAALLAACATRQSTDPPAAPSEPPAWSTPEGAEQTRLQLVEALLASGSPDAALAMVSRLRADGLDSADLDVLQARALIEVGLLDDAEGILDVTVRRSRRHAGAWNTMGVLRTEQHDIEGAVRAFEAATRAAPDDPQAWNNLGFTLHGLGRPEEAVTALREALRLDASDPRTRNNLGYALVAAGRTDEAWRTFRASTPEPVARYNLALGLELAGDLARARTEYALVLDAEPGHVLARDAITRLDAPGPPPADSPPPDTEPAP